MKLRVGKSPAYHDAIVSEKLRCLNVFNPHENEKPAFSNSSSLSFRKAPFSGDGLVFMVDQTMKE